jgi:hypothetical protein
MTTLAEFKKAFNYRHDFEDSDMQILHERHPSVRFSNIPVAWLVPIDEMLCRFKYNQAVQSVCQEYGQLIVVFKNRPKDRERFTEYQSIVDECGGKLKLIDIDLHVRMEIGGCYNGS